MDQFFTVEGQLLAVNHDCSLTEYATLLDAFTSNPLCIVQSQMTFENYLVNGINHKRHQNNKYLLFDANKKQKVDALKIGNWSIRNLLEPRGANSLHLAFIDPLGKVMPYRFDGTQKLALLKQAFELLRVLNNYESALNFSLLQENASLNQQIAALKSQIP